MNTIIKTSILFLIFSAFACSHQQNKKEERVDNIDRKQTIEKRLIHKIDGKEPKYLQTKENIVIEILTTSTRYIQLTKGLNEKIVKNGGEYFGICLERSPNPKKDEVWSYSETYDFILYEMYLERQLNTARFSFDPVSKLLYEHDQVLEKLVPIEFDRGLLLEFDSAI